MAFKLSKRSAKNLSSCHEKIREVIETSLELSAIDFGVSHGHRSPEEQKEIFAQGRTKPGKIVTYCDGFDKLSKHNHLPSLAVDVYAWVDGRASWDDEHLSYLAGVILTVAKQKGVNLFWGGHWKNFKDRPHFELK
jgi:peptidoglycan L-alanyl-D-glutamate endopeptidase CwlK